MTRCWYALEVSSSKTIAVWDDLKEAGFKSYVPRGAFWKRNAQRKRVKQILPLMPGYVFVQLASNEHRRVLDTDHVHRFVRFGAFPARISNTAMALIHTLTPKKIDQITLAYGKSLKVGMHAEIAEGVYSGKTGAITKLGDSKTRMLVYIFGSEREVEVRTDSLEAA